MEITKKNLNLKCNLNQKFKLNPIQTESKLNQNIHSIRIQFDLIWIKWNRIWILD